MSPLELRIMKLASLLVLTTCPLMSIPVLLKEFTPLLFIKSPEPLEFIIPVVSTNNSPALFITFVAPVVLLTEPETSIPPSPLFTMDNAFVLFSEPVICKLPLPLTPSFLFFIDVSPVLVTVPAIKRPSAPVSFVAVNVPSFVILPLSFKPVPVPLLRNVIAPLFFTIPVVSTRSSPEEFVTVILPFGLETSPAILTPFIPVFVIVISPEPKFLTLAPLEIDVPFDEVIIILPFEVANWLFAIDISILSVLTKLLNKASAALSFVNTVVSPPAPAINKPVL